MAQPHSAAAAALLALNERAAERNGAEQIFSVTDHDESDEDGSIDSPVFDSFFAVK